jgi:hypothetical protein
MDQEVKYIKIEELVLWSENPRDAIRVDAVDQEIVDQALNDKSGKWTLTKLAKEMGEYYDFSDLPTVVYHKDKPVVYDGNRRMILAKIKHGLVSIKEWSTIKIPEIPGVIPCNVCTEPIALKNIFRKHSDSGSWAPLERDIFLHKFMGEKKSAFLLLEENTGLISQNPHLNVGFVKEEIFKPDTLKSMGFEIKGEQLFSRHDDSQSYTILADISNKVEKKEISTRKNRGKVIAVLDRSSQEIIEQNKNSEPQHSKLDFKVKLTEEKEIRRSKRTSKKEEELFGGKLYLRFGDVSNLYRDIDDLYGYYKAHKNLLSASFPSLIRMSLRLLCESAAKESNITLDQYIKKYFAAAKQNLDQNIKTTLSNQNVNEGSLVQLLHTGAHNYQAANNMIQTIALSIILGEIFTITHGKKD